MQAKTVNICGHGGLVGAVPCLKRFYYQTAGGPKIAVAIHRTVDKVKPVHYVRGYSVTHVASGQRIARLTTPKRLPVADMVADAIEAIDEVVQRVGLDKFHAVITSAPVLDSEAVQSEVETP